MKVITDVEYKALNLNTRVRNSVDKELKSFLTSYKIEAKANNKVQIDLSDFITDKTIKDAHYYNSLKMLNKDFKELKVQFVKVVDNSARFTSIILHDVNLTKK